MLYIISTKPSKNKLFFYRKINYLKDEIEKLFNNNKDKDIPIIFYKTENFVNKKSKRKFE